LPVNRIELYRVCCSLLLERREKESRIDLSDYPALTYDQKYVFSLIWHIGCPKKI